MNMFVKNVDTFARKLNLSDINETRLRQFLKQIAELLAEKFREISFWIFLFLRS